MFGSHKVKIEGELLEKVKQCVEAGGYESVDEFVVRVLEKEVKKILAPDERDSPSKELVKKRLQGLGYIE
jgi:Arc/MetJ-type ribon-helix-helix transcriptional regulator